ncbi:putative peptidase M48 domain-containing protein [Ordospora pajunii]|jgi:STE24 endopeptidase|uniref:putative peptidase M48 domain-containing protein n=1 Tax=Ordospora pajunii TaxID=3039483 RepID=UPI0029527A46|nr:putative peptidase M48 domain-containing protein [Ordospora pajunii]KAH9411347.1 putative peptidase M48 domain-containing protein [Ordospora pajunii]
MKISLSFAVALLFAYRQAVMLHELVFIHSCMKHLKQKTLWFDRESTMGKLATSTDSFFTSQENAYKLRSCKLLRKMKLITFHALAIFLFLTDRFKNCIIGISKKIKVPAPEVALPALLLFTITLIDTLFGYKSLFIEKSYSFKQFSPSWIVPLMFVLEIFLLMHLVAYFLSVFGLKFVALCYLIVCVQAVFRISGYTGKQSDTMMKIPISTFNDDVKHMLKSEYLDESVYATSKQKITMNALHAGVLDTKRIEVHGGIVETVPEDLNVILIHEIGHSIDNIMLKRLLLECFITFLEMLMLAWIFRSGHETLGNTDMSPEAFTILTAVLYACMVKMIVYTFYNLYSQNSEIFADSIVKDKGYKDDLFRILFKLTLDNGCVIDTTFLYNSMVSLHPSIRKRIESNADD